MKVKELIAELEQYPQDLEVVFAVGTEPVSPVFTPLFDSDKVSLKKHGTEKHFFYTFFKKKDIKEDGKILEQVLFYTEFL